MRINNNRDEVFNYIGLARIAELGTEYIEEYREQMIKIQTKKTVQMRPIRRRLTND